MSLMSFAWVSGFARWFAGIGGVVEGNLARGVANARLDELRLGVRRTQLPSPFQDNSAEQHYQNVSDKGSEVERGPWELSCQRAQETKEPPRKRDDAGSDELQSLRYDPREHR